jgi:hypothetical protein
VHALVQREKLLTFDSVALGKLVTEITKNIGAPAQLTGWEADVKEEYDRIKNERDESIQALKTLIKNNVVSET